MNNYFAIERDGKCIEHIYFKDNNDDILFEDVMNMSCDEIKTCKDIEGFIVCAMDAINKFFDNKDEQTIITLISEDGIFMWSILIGPGDNKNDLRYAFIDWMKDGRSYRYEV